MPAAPCCCSLVALTLLYDAQSTENESSPVGTSRATETAWEHDGPCPCGTRRGPRRGGGTKGGREAGKRLARDAEVRARELEEADQAGELQPLRRADREPLLGVGERGDERRLGQGLGLEGEDEVVQLRQHVLQRDAAVLQEGSRNGLGKV